MKKHRSRPAPRRKPVRTPGPPPLSRPAWDAPISFESEFAYDAISGPDLEAWRDMDETERLEVVELYHEHLDVKLPSPQAHAAIHVIVENQIAMSDETPVRGTLERLTREGLDRHQAIHAIGTVLAGLINDVMKGSIRTNPTANYYAGLPMLTAQGWLAGFDDDEGQETDVAPRTR
jgi:hypothetical protein